MTIREIKGDLFTAPIGYSLVQCISSDYALGAGIAKEFNSRFKSRAYLDDHYGNLKGVYPTCLYQNLCGMLHIYHLVTKDKYWHKPTYNTLTESLINLRSHNPEKLAMPLIGCGLDRLKWTRVKKIIEDVFKDTDVEILVYDL